MKTTSKNCELCTKEFSTTRSDTKFCSTPCKQRAYNRRIKIGDLKASTEKSHQADQKLEEIKANEVQQELDKKAKQEQFLHIQKEYDQKLLDLKNEFKIEDEKRKLDFANRTLKGWLERIMKCAEYEEIGRTRLLHSLNQIKRDFNNDYYRFPKNFEHNSFVNFTLKACVDIWIHETDNSEERYLSFSIPEEILKIFDGIVEEIA